MELPQTPTKTPHIAIISSPGMGHLVPLAEFSKRLIQHNFTVTIIVPCDSPPSSAKKSVLNTLPSSISHMFLPPVNLDDLPKDAKIETIISLTLARSISSLREVVKSLMEITPLAAMVIDFFATDALDVAKEFSVPSYVFFTSLAMFVCHFLYLPKLDQMVSCEFIELQENVKVPGCMPLAPRDLMDPLHDRKNEAYKWVLHHSKQSSLADGILINTFEDLEPSAIKSLQGAEHGNSAVYPVGPLVKICDTITDDLPSECLKWLDEQPDKSVLYVCFGSGGTLSQEQMVELAEGLELSKKRFLWVVRCPNDKAANELYLSVDDQRQPLEFLPEGYLNRTKKQGFVITSWAPQVQILSHGSVGGFLSHCGWNSTLESVVNGVPMIVWPLFAEQRMTAAMLCEDVKVALRPKANEHGVVERKEIARVVKALMEGEEGNRVRIRMKDMKEAAAKAMSEDGNSHLALSHIVHKWKSQMYTQ